MRLTLFIMALLLSCVETPASLTRTRTGRCRTNPHFTAGRTRHAASASAARLAVCRCRRSPSIRVIERSQQRVKTR
jgi:hypothetical protein